MAVKYRVLYRDHYNQLCRVDVSNAAYVDEPIILRGVAEQACIISRDCGEDPYEPIVNSKASINVLQTEDYPIDILELQQAQDREFTVEVYVAEALKFKGFMVPDGIQQTFQSAPFDLNITATDGLMLLDGIPYIHNNLEGGRCPVNYFRQILFSPNNLGLPLPLSWITTLKNTRYPLEDDMLSGSVKWAPRGEGFSEYNGTRKSCLYILENMLRSMQSRIVQTNGVWEIWRINDMVADTLPVSSIGATLEGFVVTHTIFDNEYRTIAGKNDGEAYAFIDEDAILTVLPALKTVTTTYEQDQRENILPNGNMDIVDGTLNKPIYWELISPEIGSFESAPSLSAAKGNSVKISNNIGTGSNIFWGSEGWLPIDTHVLYTYLTFGFKFMIESGAAVDAEGYIDWETQPPFSVSVIYYAGDITYYLNEFGFWTVDSIILPISVPNLKLLDVAQVDFNGKQDITIPLPTTVPIGETTRPAIYVTFNLQPNIVMYLDDVYVNTDDNSDVYEATSAVTLNSGKEDYTLNISSSHNGFYVSNYMTIYAASGLEKFFTDGRYTGTLTGMTSHAILRNRYKPSLIFEGTIKGMQYNYAEIYKIKTLGDKKFLPLKSSWNTENNRVNVTLIETRDDGTGISMRHYGDNDKTTLSN